MAPGSEAFRCPTLGYRAAMLSRDDAQRAGQLIEELRDLNRRLIETVDRDARTAIHRDIDARYDELAHLIPAF
jgi:hypothetical protein